MSVKIYWAGDSTVKKNDFTTYPQTGIGQALGLFLKEKIRIENHAENGRSSKSFLDESRLAPIYNEIEENDFLFIQFGHNDAKESDASRFTQPFGEYRENLIKMINMARNRKAHPVLITPLSRCWFEDENTLEKDIHGDYPKAMHEVSQELKVPLLDLFSRSRKGLLDLGQKKSRLLFMNLQPGEYKNYPAGLEDNTHLKYDGAVMFAEMIAQELKEVGGKYEELVKDEFTAVG